MRLAAFLSLGALYACSSTPAPGTDAGSLGNTPSDAAPSTADAGDTWSSFAQGFFATYCVECHGAGNAKRDYSTLDNVVRDKDMIRCGVAPTQQPGCGAAPAPKQFPISNAAGTNPKPSDAERTRILAWIAAGLP
jgi:hypothetical protein